MTAAPNISRRKVPRFRIKVRVTCLMQDDVNQAPVVFETENLSVQGMRISKQSEDRSPANLKLSDDRHHFWIYFDEKKPAIKVSGNVVYLDQSKQCFGIKFGGLEREHSASLSRFITKKATENPDIIVHE